MNHDRFPGFQRVIEAGNAAILREYWCGKGNAGHSQEYKKTPAQHQIVSFTFAAANSGAKWSNSTSADAAADAGAVIVRSTPPALFFRSKWRKAQQACSLATSSRTSSSASGS
jgi:hypothetical protein